MSEFNETMKTAAFMRSRVGEPAGRSVRLRNRLNGETSTAWTLP